MNSLKEIYTKEISEAVQGAAVLLMLFHHYFMAPDNLGLLAYADKNVYMRAAWFAKICVALFTFVSGYGLALSAKLRLDRELTLGAGILKKLRVLYKGSFKRIFGLYFKLWLVLFLFKAGELLVLKIKLEPLEFVQNALGFSSSYNGAWWYVPWYSAMVLVFPFIYLLFDKDIRLIKRLVCIGFFIVFCIAMLFVGFLANPYVLSVILLLKAVLRFTYVLVFMVGVFAAVQGKPEMNVDNQAAMYDGEKRIIFLAKLLEKRYVGGLILLAVIALRVLLAPDGNYSQLDFIFAPLFVLGLTILIKGVRPVVAVLGWFGKHSTFMWLTHLLILAYSYYPLAPIVKTAGAFFAAELLLNMVAAVVLKWIEEAYLNVVFKKAGI